MKICLLGSGSKGNCLYMESHGAAVIIDQGFSHIEVMSRLASRGLDEGRIRGILLTHEHEDHIRGAGITARKLGIPVYATPGTLSGRKNIFTGEESLIPIESGRSFKIGALEFHPFSVSHDARDPVQYCISSGNTKVSVATDLGYVSTLVEQRLRGSHLVVVESNHDVEMLKKGSYPWELKQRILSRTGHLSNRNAAELLFNLCREEPLQAVLAHLSEENNRADIAEREVIDLFERYDCRLRSLLVALQQEATPVFEL
ncbi:MAG: MBL fold metallo-hydrolase [Candidatus Latescibacter sp.]|nr:MBL fold metallo-hydrolase [Candidatus Latescibacter sp.]